MAEDKTFPFFSIEVITLFSSILMSGNVLIPGNNRFCSVGRLERNVKQVASSRTHRKIDGACLLLNPVACFLKRVWAH